MSSERTEGSWATFAASGADADSLTALATTDAASLSGTELVDAIVASEKALSLLAGLQMRLMKAFTVPFKAGDPMRLAAKIARKSCITGDDDPDQVQLFVPEAAICLAAAEISAALRISPITAGIRVREADAMTTDLAATLGALESGVLDRGKARIIAERCAPLGPEESVDVQELVLPEAGELNNGELRELTDEAVIIVDPRGAEERHLAAAARRDLTLRPQPDAMATLSAFLPADAAVKIYQLSDLLATGSAGAAGDSRGIGNRRADALADVCGELLTSGFLDLTHYLGKELPDCSVPPVRHRANAGSDDTDHDEAGADSADKDLPDNNPAGSDTPADADADPAHPADADPAAADPADAGPDAGAGPDADADPAAADPADPATPRRVLTRQGRRPHLSVTIGLGTLAGIDDLPGKLAGFGAIPASLARAIATSAATVTALITDPVTGINTEAGALTYRPSQRLRDQVAALMGTCQFPSCRQPVWRCDIDHREPFDHRQPARGGRTEFDNSGPLCRRHHLIKHHADWCVRANTDRFTLEWTSPTGHRYKKKPSPNIVPDLFNMKGYVTTAGTAVAERLDTLAGFRGLGAPEGNRSSVPSSSVDELATLLLLRHELNQPSPEYDPPDSVWDMLATDQSAGSRSQPDGDQEIDLPDEPPF